MVCTDPPSISVQTNEWLKLNGLYRPTKHFCANKRMITNESGRARMNRDKKVEVKGWTTFRLWWLHYPSISLQNIARKIAPLQISRRPLHYRILPGRSHHYRYQGGHFITEYCQEDRTTTDIKEATSLQNIARKIAPLQISRRSLHYRILPGRSHHYRYQGGHFITEYCQEDRTTTDIKEATSLQNIARKIAPLQISRRPLHYRILPGRSHHYRYQGGHFITEYCQEKSHHYRYQGGHFITEYCQEDRTTTDIKEATSLQNIARKIAPLQISRRPFHYRILPGKIAPLQISRRPLHYRILPGKIAPLQISRRSLHLQNIARKIAPLQISRRPLHYRILPGRSHHYRYQGGHFITEYCQERSHHYRYQGGHFITEYCQERSHHYRYQGGHFITEYCQEDRTTTGIKEATSLQNIARKITPLQISRRPLNYRILPGKIAPLQISRRPLHYRILPGKIAPLQISRRPLHYRILPGKIAPLQISRRPLHYRILPGRSHHYRYQGGHFITEYCQERSHHYRYQGGHFITEYCQERSHHYRYQGGHFITEYCQEDRTTTDIKEVTSLQNIARKDRTTTDIKEATSLQNIARKDRTTTDIKESLLGARHLGQDKWADFIKTCLLAGQPEGVTCLDLKEPLSRNKILTFAHYMPAKTKENQGSTENDKCWQKNSIKAHHCI